MYPYSNLGELAIFNVEGDETDRKANVPFPGKLIGGGDDGRELRGQMPVTWLTDPPPPLHVNYLSILDKFFSADPILYYHDSEHSRVGSRPWRPCANFYSRRPARLNFGDALSEEGQEGIYLATSC